MSRSCELLGVKPQTGHYVPINRSQTGVRSNRRFDPNIQNVRLVSDVLGNQISLRVAVKTLRTVEHNGGLDKFLINTSNRKLTTRGKQLKTKVLKALTPEAFEEMRDKADPKNHKPNRSKRLEKKLAAKGKEEAKTAKKETAKAAPKKAAPKKTAAKKPAAKKTEK